MAGTPIPHGSPKTSNVGNNHSGKTTHDKGPKTNPSLMGNRGNKDTRSGQAYNPRPAGFAPEAHGSPVKGVKVGGANGSGAGFGANSGIK